MKPGTFRIIFSVSLLLVFTGCHSIGPRTVATDRFDYSAAIADSWGPSKRSYRVSTFPGSAFVILPSSMTGTPFTSTKRMPSES